MPLSPLVRHPGNLQAGVHGFKSVDSRLKISGMTAGEDSLNASIIPLSVIPEWFYEGSKLFKDKNLWMPDKSAQA